MIQLNKLKIKIHNFVKETKASDTIEVIKLLFIFYAGRRVVLVFALFFALLGIIKSLTSPEEFHSTSKVLTNQNANLLGRGFSGLSVLSGVGNLNTPRNDGEIITPELYPEIIFNDDFLLIIAQDTLYFKNLEKSMDLVTFFSEYEEKNWFAVLFSLPRLIVSKIKSSNEEVKIDSTMLPKNVDALYRIGPRESSAIRKLTSRIEITKLDRIIQISVKMPDSEVSTEVNNKIINALTDYVVKINTDRERENLEFVEIQTEEAKSNFEVSQMKLASFRDKNMGIVTQSAKTTEQRLQAEYELAFQLYNSLAQQYQQSKLKFQEAKPILTIFQKPKVPLAPSEPNLILTTLIFTFLGTFFGVVFIIILLIKNYIQN